MQPLGDAIVLDITIPHDPPTFGIVLFAAFCEEDRLSDTQQSRKLKSMRDEPAPQLDQVRRDVADRATIVAALPRFLALPPAAGRGPLIYARIPFVAPRPRRGVHYA